VLAAHDEATAPSALATTPARKGHVQALMKGVRLIPLPPIWVPEKTATRTFGSTDAETSPIASAMDTTKAGLHQHHPRCPPRHPACWAARRP